MPRKRTGSPYKRGGIWHVRLTVEREGATIRERVCLETEHWPIAEAKIAALLATGAASLPTVRELGERWTSGDLAAEYPDHVRAARSAKHLAWMLARHVYPHVGSTPIDRVTLDDCMAILRAMPADARNRNHVAGTLRRIFRLAVWPLRLIETSPLPPGFVPRRPPRRALAWLWPDEDRRLLGAVERDGEGSVVVPGIPLEWRLLWGVLVREGMRASEATALEWGDLDLQRGLIRLDRNKTDDPRTWALDPGVHTTLAWLRERLCSEESTRDLVFRMPRGGAVYRGDLAKTFRTHLRMIGLEQERPELFETTAERQQIRVHDLRGTFVTCALASGKSEAWIADRTGHRSSIMIARYKRTARTWAEAGIAGDLTPLCDALPEVAEETARKRP